MSDQRTLFIGVKEFDSEPSLTILIDEIMESKGAAFVQFVDDDTFGYNNRGAFVVPKGYISLIDLASKCHEMSISEDAARLYGNELFRCAGYLLGQDKSPSAITIGFGVVEDQSMSEELSIASPSESVEDIGRVINMRDFKDRR